MSSVIDQFAELLRQHDDPVKRKALLKRAEMQAMQETDPSVFEPPVRTLGEYLDTPIEVPPSLVWPTICVRGEVTTTLGRAGYGKTTMNMNRILKWAAGLPLYDTFSDEEGKVYLNPEKPLKTLIIENEGAAGMFHQKIGIMLHNGDVFTPEQIKDIRENVLIWGDGGYSGLKLDDPNMLNEVRLACEKHSPDIVFVEPFRSLWKGEENSSTDMALVVDNLIGMATDYGCGIILSHHERKSGAGEDGELMSAGRGSTVLEGAVALMENFQKAAGGDYRELTWSKARYLQPPPPTRLQYDTAAQWYRHVPVDEIANSILRVLDQQDDYMSLRELADETGEKQTKLRPLLSKLEEEKRVVKLKADGANAYRLPTTDGDGPGGLPL